MALDSTCRVTGEMTALQRGLWRRRKAFGVFCGFWEPPTGSIRWTQRRRSQRGPRPHRLLDLLLCLTPLHSLPFPGFPAPAPKHSVWFLVLGSSLLRPAPALFAHSSFPLLSLLAVCLWARPLRVGMLLLFTSLSLVRFLRHIHSLLSPVTSQPHGAVAVLSLPCPLEASSE